MAEPILVDAAWQTATYGLIGVVVTLCGVIVKMAHWWIFKERPKVAVKFEENDTALSDMVYKNQKALDRNSDYLRDWFNELHPEKATRTQFDFNGEKEK